MFYLLLLAYLLDVLLVVLVCKFEVIKKLIFINYLKSCFLCTRGQGRQSYIVPAGTASIYRAGTFAGSETLAFCIGLNTRRIGVV